ncbi:MAG: TIGR04076 family protein [Syntrophorhabdaceae bacterium]|nr:TIGR04076 family protein [Syntrophorhabdaceae bacterium]
MAKDPDFGRKIKAEVTSLKGQCNAGHRVGDTFDVSCYNTGGMCGFLYNAIFPTLNVMQFEGSYPWGTDEAVVNCPDSYNLLTVKLWRTR